MANWLTYWIQRGMESDAEREAAARAYFSKVLEQSDKVLKRWERPIRGPGYWNSAEAMAVSKGRHAEAAGQPVNAYEVALNDIAVAAARRSD